MVLFTHDVKLCQKDQRCHWQKPTKNGTCKRRIRMMVLFLRRRSWWFYFVFEAVLRIAHKNVTKHWIMKCMQLCRQNFLFGCWRSQWVGVVFSVLMWWWNEHLWLRADRKPPPVRSLPPVPYPLAPAQSRLGTPWDTRCDTCINILWLYSYFSLALEPSKKHCLSPLASRRTLGLVDCSLSPVRPRELSPHLRFPLPSSPAPV